MNARFATVTILSVLMTCPSLNSGMDRHLKMNTVEILTLTREGLEDGAIIGDLYVDGKWICKTRESSEYLIKTGSYKVTLYRSPKFHYIVPLIHVPGHEGIEIHPGEQSKGCILVSKYAFNQLMNELTGPCVLNIS